MAAFSDYLENLVLNFLFRDGTFDRPTEIAIGLSTEILSDDDTGNVVTEVATGVGYSRQVLGPANDDWADSNNGITSNSGKLSFGKATDNWGTVKAFFITDDSTYGSGNLLLHGALTIERDVYLNDTFEVNISDLRIQLK